MKNPIENVFKTQTNKQKEKKMSLFLMLKKQKTKKNGKKIRNKKTRLNISLN